MTVLQIPAAGGGWDDARKKASQAIFSAIDRMTHWARWAEKSRRPEKAAGSRSRGGHHAGATPDISSRIKRVHTFLRKLPDDVIAVASHNCQDHARALFHLERHIAEKRVGDALHKLTSPKLPETKVCSTERADIMLQTVYSKLGDMDGMTGTRSTRLTTPLAGELRR